MLDNNETFLEQLKQIGTKDELSEIVLCLISNTSQCDDLKDCSIKRQVTTIKTLVLLLEMVEKT